MSPLGALSRAPATVSSAVSRTLYSKAAEAQDTAPLGTRKGDNKLLGFVEQFALFGVYAGAIETRQAQAVAYESKANIRPLYSQRCQEQLDKS